MKYYVISPSGKAKYIEANSMSELDAKASKEFGEDYWINNKRYAVLTADEYSQQIRSQSQQTQPQTQPQQQEVKSGLLDRFAEGVSEFAFPVATGMAKRGADPIQFLPVAAGEAALMVLPTGIASKAAEFAGLKGLQSLITRGILEGSITALGDQAVSAAGGQDKTMAESVLSGATAMLPDVIQAGIAKSRTAAKSVAPKVLEYGLVPDKATRHSLNPPDYERMLKEGIVTPFGGLEQASENVARRLEPLFASRDAIVKSFDDAVVEKNGIITRGRKIDLRKVEDLALEEIKNAKLSPVELSAAKDRIQREFMEMRHEYGRYVYAGDIDDVKNKIDAKYTDLREPAAERGKEAVRSAMSTTLKDVVPGYAEKTEEMAKYIPMRDVIESRITNRQKPIVWLRDMPGMGLAGAGTAASMLMNDPSIAIAGLLGGGITSGTTRLFSTPGGAAILYRYGTSSIGDRLVPYAKPFAVSLGRGGDD